MSLLALFATAQASATPGADQNAGQQQDNVASALNTTQEAPDYMVVPVATTDAYSPNATTRGVMPVARTDRYDPLVTSATQRLLPGKIVFSMLVTPDLVKAEKFYGPLFGWGFRSVSGGNAPRVEVMLAGRPIGTIVAHELHHPAQDVPFWMPFISTSDTATIARVTRRYGGHVLFGPRQMDGLGQAVIVSDPQHGLYAALSAQSGDPVDTPSAPATNSWSWATLLTPSPSMASGYYQMLFNYQVSVAPGADRGEHYILSSQGKERASINTLPEGVMPADKARWLQFIQVGSSATVASQAASLGGRVIVPPHPDRDGALVAILADPEGAVFGVIEPRNDRLEMGPAR